MRPVIWSDPVNWNNSLNDGLLRYFVNVPHWRGGTTLWDLCGLGDGVLTNMNPVDDWSDDSNPGGSGSLDFDGSNDVVNCGSRADIDNIAVKTITAWVKVRINDNEHIFVAKDSTGFSFMVDLRDISGQRRRLVLQQDFTTDAGEWHTPNQSFQGDGTWRHVGVTYDRTSDQNQPVFYLDGKLSATTERDSPSGSASNDAAQNLVIGSRQGGGNTVDGLLNDVRIYKRGLSAAEHGGVYEESLQGNPNVLNRLPRRGVVAPVAAGGRPMSSLASTGGLAGVGGIAGPSGGLAG